MAKIQLKKELAEEYGLSCYICGESITEEQIENGECDTDRLIPKAEGQEYDIDITRIACPVCHMKRHGTHRLRSEDLGALKVAIDDREQWMKLLNKIENQLRAYSRDTDECSEITRAQLEEMAPMFREKVAQRSKLVEKWIKGHADEGLVASLINVPGMGPQTAAYLITYCIPEKARHRSSYWKYAGLHCASGDRYQKGVAGGGNKRLRVALWRCVDSMWKRRDNPYRLIGDQVKGRLEVSEKLVQSRNTQGKLVTVPWSETKKGHRHGAAYRKMMKELLGDYWVVSRKFAGLPTDNPYVADMLGHENMTDARDRGWLYPEDIKS